MLDTLVFGLLRSEDRNGEFFKAAVDLGLEGIVSKRAKSLYRRRPSRSWLKNMIEGEFIILGTEVDDSGIPWALLAREQNGELKFAGPAILRAYHMPGLSGPRSSRRCRSISLH